MGTRLSAEAFTRADGFRIQRFAAELLLERLRRVLAGDLVGGVGDELGVRVRVPARAALEAAPRNASSPSFETTASEARGVRARAAEPARVRSRARRRRASRRSPRVGERRARRCRRRAGLEPARWARARWTGRGGRSRGRARASERVDGGGGSEGRERPRKCARPGVDERAPARGTRRSRTRRASRGAPQLGPARSPSGLRPPRHRRDVPALRDRRAAPSSRARACARRGGFRRRANTRREPSDEQRTRDGCAQIARDSPRAPIVIVTVRSSASALNCRLKHKPTPARPRKKPSSKKLAHAFGVGPDTRIRAWRASWTPSSPRTTSWCSPPPGARTAWPAERAGRRERALAEVDYAACDAGVREAVRARHRHRSAPAVFARGRFVGGCNDGPEPWMGALKLLRSGRLQSALTAKL